jgi:hypothetical protein
MKQRMVAAGMVAAGAALMLFSFPQVASAQHEIFAASQKTPTSVAGVSIIQDRPAGFNPLTASSADLSKYGLPARPDQASDPQGYAQWARAMTALSYRAADVKAMPYSSKNLMLAKQPAGAASAEISAAPTQLFSYNWSGVANTNTLQYWDPNTSFTSIESVWTVPGALPPFKACAKGIKGALGVPGFYVATWNGIDGVSNGDVLQGGSLAYADCGGPADNAYIGWVEWYPSYPILEIVCNTSGGLVPCPVNAGDVFFVVTYGADSGTQNVFVEDATEGWYGTFALGYISGPLLVGSSEEQVMERPCCDTRGYPLALTNYLAQSLAFTVGYDGHGTQFFAGSQNAATGVIDMIDDDANQIISAVIGQGSTGFQGKYSLFLESANCTYSGGCKSR